jgi:hypothetical protein
MLNYQRVPPYLPGFFPRLEAGPFQDLQRFRWHNHEAPTIQVLQHATKAPQGLGVWQKQGADSWGIL